MLYILSYNGAVMLWQLLFAYVDVGTNSCDLRSLVDEATGAMLVSMRVVWEPTGSWPTCLQR